MMDKLQGNDDATAISVLIKLVIFLVALVRWYVGRHKGTQI